MRKSKKKISKELLKQQMEALNKQDEPNPNVEEEIKEENLEAPKEENNTTTEENKEECNCDSSQESNDEKNAQVNQEETCEECSKEEVKEEKECSCNGECCSSKETNDEEQVEHKKHQHHHDEDDDEEQEDNHPKHKLHRDEKRSLLKEIDSLHDKIHELEEKTEDWKNKYYEAHADLANTRRQIEKDNDNFRKYLSMSIVNEILPSLDALELTVKMAPSDEQVKKYVQGTRMIFQMFQTNLEGLGYTTKVPEIGEKFDAATMNAVDTVEVEDGEDNVVKEVQCRCYLYKDRVLRPSNVVVTKLKTK